MAPVKLILMVLFLAMGWVVALTERRLPGTGERQGQRGMKGGGRVPEQGEVRYLALGDSYTIGEAVAPEERYPDQVSRLLAANGDVVCGEPEIIALTGWTTGDLLGALAGKEGRACDKGGRPYDIVSLLIGVNNQYQGRTKAEYREQFTLLLQECIRLAGNRAAHVVVLSIPDYSVTPFARWRDTARIAAQIDSFNCINFELARESKVRYVNVTAESRKAATDPTLIAGDGLHFSGKEYGEWAKLMEPVLRGMLK